MTADVLHKVLQAIAHDIYLLTQQCITKEGLRNSLLNKQARVEVANWDNPVINIILDDYIEYVEKGRIAGKGKLPSIDSLRDWALQHFIPIDNSTLYAIARAIQKNGIAPRPILLQLEKQIDDSFENKWADMLFEAIVNEVETYFSDN